MNKKIQNILDTKPWIWLITMFVVSFVVKLFVIIPFEGPIVFADELYYKMNAEALSRFSYFTSHYPPLYSLFLSPAFIFGDNFYIAMKVINSIISSLLVFPVWFISREFLDKRTSIFLCLISMLLPFHFSSSQQLMSEVLYYPLYIFSIFAFLKMLKTQATKWYVISAILLAASLLTRYISVAMVPALVIVYVYDGFTKKHFKNSTKELALKLIIFLIIFLALLSVFYIPYLDSFLKTSSKYTSPILKQTALSKPAIPDGFVTRIIENITSPPRLVAWFCIYSSYFILLIAPFIYPITRNVIEAFRNRKNEHDKFILVLCTLLCSSLYVVLATRHSGNKDYTEQYMLGRYVMFALPVIFIAFLDFKDRDRKWNGVSKVVSFTLVFFATIVLIGRLFGTADYLMLSHVSPDGNIFKIAPAITLSILALTVISSMYVRKWYPMLVVIFYLVCAFYAKDINNSQLFKQEALIAKHINKDEGDISIYIDHSYSISDSIFRFKSNSKSIELTRYLRFWNIKNKLHIGTFIIDTTGKTKGFVLTSRLIPLETPIDSIVIKDEQQYLYKIPFNNLTKRIDLFSQMDSTNGNPVKTSQYENTMLSHERFGFIQSFLYDKGLITREVTYPDPFFFFNSAKSILTYEHEIIMTNNQNYMLQFEVDSSSQSSLNCQFGITKLAKTWNVSDGMHLTIKYYDELQGDILLAGQFIVPRLRDYVVSVPLPATRRKKFKLYFDTSSSGLHGNGDWLRINSLDIVSN